MRARRVRPNSSLEEFDRMHENWAIHAVLSRKDGGWTSRKSHEA
ncbi:MAG: hypothetical protein AVDCRST_MAG03-2065 [uncultured Rubrobacteraceae bacterium]|uniref:Uncharacterized protein n=1 Tax=uncultured Rubrobacteraceae bacterium TaxID=349277 RepID=A0A6J4PER6_9ACTN|nr:MAG: hypothetical protein AVDCRST_MAG03-2065 [uncultured Rubrobacteraceae bacterium]